MATNRAGELTLLHGLECLRDGISDLDTSLLQLLSRGAQTGILLDARCQLAKYNNHQYTKILRNCALAW